ncbi:MBL fold metallo-hydrolase [Propionispora vibrioides]|uniref:Glyoxylase, beta-lactamase superfamily II n=1 Tax=Propionispora vibrioides TaxID=112903 RepID=A0A1H8NVY0_9FIRM|nr:MBL fold metallo-hydrolase [Propionispora vibrioides]SEO33806.1 Glyoxylase, beta-lactamase superfamily II [Propionispora vibrioides]
MEVIAIEVGALGTNCYIVYCEKTRQAIVVDPGANAAEILQTVQEQKLQVTAIVNTHGHADHITANDKIREATQAPVYIHADDAAMLTSPQRNLSVYIGAPVICQAADRLLQEEDLVAVGEGTLRVLHTPGHTPGGICLLGDKFLLSGDTLFAESVGRTDFPGGSSELLIAGIREKLMVLPDDIKVLPGHGPATTIGWERRMNSFIRM